MNVPAPASFDYGTLDAQNRDFAMEAAQRIRLRMRKAAEDILEIGRDLIEVKERLGHGHYRPWLQAEFEMSFDTAERFVHVAKMLRESKCRNLRHLRPSALYELASPSTPLDVREQVEARSNAGEVIDLSEVKRLKEQWASEKKELKRQLDESKDKVKGVKATQADYGQQIEALHAELRALRSERDVLQYELKKLPSSVDTDRQIREMQALITELRVECDDLRDNRISSTDLDSVTRSTETSEIESVESQIAVLMADWIRVSPQARQEFLSRVKDGAGSA